MTVWSSEGGSHACNVRFQLTQREVHWPHLLPHHSEDSLSTQTFSFIAVMLGLIEHGGKAAEWPKRQEGQGAWSHQVC